MSLELSRGPSSPEELWQVAVDAPLPTPLIYGVRDGLTLERGAIVKVPLGKRVVNGIVIGPGAAAAGDFQVKKILDVEPFPLLPAPFIKWLEWLAGYYLHPIGMVMNMVLPPLKKEGKSRKSPVIPEAQATQVPELTHEQLHCIQSILEKKGFNAHLLYGVTGSGKTEVYLRLLEKNLKLGKQALILVPEISLTPQLIRRFVNRLGQHIAVIHSHLTEREKTDQWWHMVDGKKQILIGARSALFCPLKNLGLIIVDEEHEASFKQEEQLKYHARDSAIMLAKQFDCPIVLGSATPSLESWKNAQEGKYHLHHMRQRVENRPMPLIEIVDMKDWQIVKKNADLKEEEQVAAGSWLSPVLEAKIRVRLEKGEQTALFLNRRGMAQTILCPGCGHSRECPNCSVALTLHSRVHLVCHYCDYHENLPPECPECKQSELKPIGVGTEKVEADLQKLFPKARLARADRDNINGRESLDELISQIENREVDIIVGTQMIAKGLDFEQLTLVGVILADIGFNLPDFRSSERSFQLLMQVSGRSGRHLAEGRSAGEVVIQTYNPQHTSIEYTKKHDYEGFAAQELNLRRELFYPPFGRIVSIRVQGNNLSDVHRACRSLVLKAQTLQKHHRAFSTLEALGPAEMPMAKLRGQHRYHLLVKGQNHAVLAPFCQKLCEIKVPGVKIAIDVDPLHML